MSRSNRSFRDDAARCWRGPLCLLTVALTLSAAPAVQAQATPTTADLDVPPPRDCTIAPHPTPLLPPGVGQRAAATPAPIVMASPTPFAPLVGEAADAETVTAVTATVREAIACRNADDFLRVYALFTQDMIVTALGGPASVDVVILQALAEGPRPIPRAERLALISVGDVTLLPDGRVGAIVQTRNPQTAFRDYLIFEDDPATGRWLIDEAEELT